MCLPVCACACACACACVLRCGCVHGMLAARRGEACAFVGWGNGRCVYVCMCVLGGGVSALACMCLFGYDVCPHRHARTVD